VARPLAPDPFAGAARLSAVLGEHALLIGGLAVAAWGFVRATEDIELVSDLGPDALRRRLKAAGIATEVARGNTDEGDIPWVVQGRIEDMPFQVLPPLTAIAWDRARIVPLPGGGELRVVDLDALLRLKLRAGGPKDLMDIAELLALYPDREEDARRTAEAYGVTEKLDVWLARRRPRTRR
jgi:hypothetical protein